MSAITIIPIEPRGKNIHLADSESVHTFDVAEEMRTTVFDVLSDGKYSVSLCRIPLPAEQCYWELFQRIGGSLDWMGRPDRWQ